MFNSLEQMYLLKQQGLAVEKVHHELPLVLFKYHRRVMYEYLWKKRPELMEVRGHVYDLETDKIVQCPFRKTFNYGEDGWWMDVPLNRMVVVFKKYNGSMVSATKYNGMNLVTTTGSFDSEYANRAAKMFSNNYFIELDDEYTNLYEMIDEVSDPHIVKEERQGLVPIAIRIKKTGEILPRGNAEVMELGEALRYASDNKGEGFIVYDLDDDQNSCKLKTPYYTGKKMLMRMNSSRVESMYRHKAVDNLPSMWQDAISMICNSFTVQEWKEMTDQARRNFLDTKYSI